ncbi:hypothetical protein [Brucella pituitosa]|uniref:hypothetical protein n=1 Tax=Brucella pituitosa TaxID=571256 RepID=UPI000C2729D5|nr:hypothetical protein [Brucella pituitosa]PJO47193.1 hypothetical protein CWE02_19205 [Brucella pituitosa]
MITIKTTDNAAITLGSSTVTRSLRSAIFDAAGRRGVTTTEFVLDAAARHLRSQGQDISGVFSEGDLDRPERRHG